MSFEHALPPAVLIIQRKINTELKQKITEIGQSEQEKYNK